MKFKVTKVNKRPSIINRKIMVRSYRITSLCGKYKKVVKFFNNKPHPEEGDIIDWVMVSDVERLKTRLKNWCNIDITLVGNTPWIYLESVNGVRVTEHLHANHGFCIGYWQDVKYLKETIAKVREIRDNGCEIKEHVYENYN